MENEIILHLNSLGGYSSKMKTYIENPHICSKRQLFYTLCFLMVNEVPFDLVNNWFCKYVAPISYENQYNINDCIDDAIGNGLYHILTSTFPKGEILNQSLRNEYYFKCNEEEASLANPCRQQTTPVIDIIFQPSDTIEGIRYGQRFTVEVNATNPDETSAEYTINVENAVMESQIGDNYHYIASEDINDKSILITVNASNCAGLSTKTRNVCLMTHHDYIDGIQLTDNAFKVPYSICTYLNGTYFPTTSTNNVSSSYTSCGKRLKKPIQQIVIQKCAGQPYGLHPTLNLPPYLQSFSYDLNSYDVYIDFIKDCTTYGEYTVTFYNTVINTDQSRSDESKYWNIRVGDYIPMCVPLLYDTVENVFTEINNGQEDIFIPIDANNGYVYTYNYQNYTINGSSVQVRQEKITVPDKYDDIFFRCFGWVDTTGRLPCPDEQILYSWLKYPDGTPYYHIPATFESYFSFQSFSDCLNNRYGDPAFKLNQQPTYGTFTFAVDVAINNVWYVVTKMTRNCFEYYVFTEIILQNDDIIVFFPDSGTRTYSTRVMNYRNQDVSSNYVITITSDIDGVIPNSGELSPNLHNITIHATSIGRIEPLVKEVTMDLTPPTFTVDPIPDQYTDTPSYNLFYAGVEVLPNDIISDLDSNLVFDENTLLVSTYGLHTLTFGYTNNANEYVTVQTTYNYLPPIIGFNADAYAYDYYVHKNDNIPIYVPTTGISVTSDIDGNLDSPTEILNFWRMTEGLHTLNISFMYNGIMLDLIQSHNENKNVGVRGRLNQPVIQEPAEGHYSLSYVPQSFYRSYWDSIPRQWLTYDIASVPNQNTYLHQYAGECYTADCTQTMDGLWFFEQYMVPKFGTPGNVTTGGIPLLRDVISIPYYIGANSISNPTLLPQIRILLRIHYVGNFENTVISVKDQTDTDHDFPATANGHTQNIYLNPPTNPVVGWNFISVSLGISNSDPVLYAIDTIETLLPYGYSVQFLNTHQHTKFSYYDAHIGIRPPDIPRHIDATTQSNHLNDGLGMKLQCDKSAHDDTNNFGFDFKGINVKDHQFNFPLTGVADAGTDGWIAWQGNTRFEKTKQLFRKGNCLTRSYPLDWSNYVYGDTNYDYIHVKKNCYGIFILAPIS